MKQITAIEKGIEKVRSHFQTPSFDPAVCEWLYADAKRRITQSGMPSGRNTLALNCDTVSAGMLCSVRELVDSGAKLTIGWISLDKKSDYKFSYAELKRWHDDQSSTPNCFGGHAWISVKRDILDFTLIATSANHYPNDGRFEGKTYLTRSTARDIGIELFPVAYGDDVLNPFLQSL